MPEHVRHAIGEGKEYTIGEITEESAVSAFLPLRSEAFGMEDAINLGRTEPVAGRR